MPTSLGHDYGCPSPCINWNSTINMPTPSDWSWAARPGDPARKNRTESGLPFGLGSGLISQPDRVFGLGSGFHFPDFRARLECVEAETQRLARALGLWAAFRAELGLEKRAIFGFQVGLGLVVSGSGFCKPTPKPGPTRHMTRFTSDTSPTTASPCDGRLDLPFVILCPAYHLCPL